MPARVKPVVPAVTMMVRLPIALRVRLEEAARQGRVSMNALLVESLRVGLDLVADVATEKRVDNFLMGL